MKALIILLIAYFMYFVCAMGAVLIAYCYHEIDEGDKDGK